MNQEECMNALKALGLNLLDNTEDRFVFEIPSWRHDLEREVDLIEEIARLRGFDIIPSVLPVMNMAPNKEHPMASFQEKTRCFWACLGLSEVINYPFTSEKDYENLLCHKKHPLWPSVSLENALNIQTPWMRTTLLPGLLNCALKNRSYNHKASRLFEIGRGFIDGSKKVEDFKKFSFSKEILRDELFLGSQEKSNAIRERTYLSCLLDTPFMEKNWHQKKEVEAGFYTAKSLLEQFFQAFNIRHVRWEKTNPIELPYLHPGLSAQVYHKNRYLGCLGEVHPEVAFQYGLESDIPIMIELDLEMVFSCIQNEIKVAARLNRYPGVIRDMAFLLKEDVSYADFSKEVKNCPHNKYLSDFFLFDVYTGEGLEKGYKSFASQFTFKAQDKTLSEKDISQELDALTTWLYFL